MDADRPERQFRNLFYERQRRLLQSITQRNKYTQALTYSHGQIAFVSDSYTRKLTFGYSSGLLTTVSTPEFTSGLTYGYVNFSSAAKNLLTTVTYATSPATHQTYLYENTSFPYALTGITDENGKRYATWGYDGTGRGILSELAGAVNYTSVTYDDTTGNRIVKGPLGIVETYKFTNLQGVPKVTEIDRAANSPVASATETFAYDFERLPQQPERLERQQHIMGQQQPRLADPDQLCVEHDQQADHQHHL